MLKMKERNEKSQMQIPSSSTISEKIALKLPEKKNNRDFFFEYLHAR